MKPSKQVALAATFDLKAAAKVYEQEALALFVTAMRQKTSMPASRLEAAGRILEIVNGTLNGEVIIITPVPPPDPPAEVA